MFWRDPDDSPARFSTRLRASASVCELFFSLSSFAGLARNAVFQSGLLVPQFRLQRLGDGDVREGDHHAVNPVVQGAVGHDPHGEPAAVARGHRLLRRGQRAQHAPHVGRQRRVVQVRDQVGDGPPHVARDELDDLRRLGGEPPDAEFLVQEQGRDVRAFEQVLHVVAGLRQLVHLGLQLGVERLEFLVQGLHLLLRGGEFLVGGLQLFIRGLQFLVGGPEFLLRGLHLFVCGPRLGADLQEFLLQSRVAGVRFGRSQRRLWRPRARPRP